MNLLQTLSKRHIQPLKILEYFIDENPLDKFHKNFVAFSKKNGDNCAAQLYKILQKMKYITNNDTSISNASIKATNFER